MTGPNLLIPAVVVFVLLVVGLLLTIREFHNERGLGKAPLDHTPEIKKPSPDQVRDV